MTAEHVLDDRPRGPTRRTANKVPEVTAFWTAYVLTRPLGASLADRTALAHTRGGLGPGLAPVTLAWTAAILGFVGHLAVSQRDRRAAAATVDEFLWSGGS
jgi:uncharacterized membrane-anchored protein